MSGPERVRSMEGLGHTLENEMMTQDMVKAGGEQEGPVTTNQDGNLDTPVRMCAYREHRCKHFGVHDWHYFYCAAQDAPNKHAGPRDYAYPWRGAGKQLRDNKPDAGCPFCVA